MADVGGQWRTLRGRLQNRVHGFDSRRLHILSVRQAVRPAQARLDIALVGFVWMLPLYRGAFTRYSLESS